MCPVRETSTKMRWSSGSILTTCMAAWTPWSADICKTTRVRDLKIVSMESTVNFTYYNIS